MSTVHLHLLLTHVPVLGIVFGTLLLAYDLRRRQETLQQTSLGVFALGGIPHAVIEAHEEAAALALVAART